MSSTTYGSPASGGTEQAIIHPRNTVKTYLFIFYRLSSWLWQTSVTPVDLNAGHFLSIPQPTRNKRHPRRETCGTPPERKPRGCGTSGSGLSFPGFRGSVQIYQFRPPDNETPGSGSSSGNPCTRFPREFYWLPISETPFHS